MPDDPIIPKRKRKRVPVSLRGPSFSVKQVEVQEKRLEALELRKAGASYPQIAKQMGLSTPMMAWRYVNDAIAAIPVDAAKEVKALMLASIDADLVRLNNKHASVKTVIEETRLILAKDRLRESQARLLGLNAPIRNEHTGKDGGAILTGHVDLEGMSDDQLERFKRDPASFLAGVAGSRDSGAEEEAQEAPRGARRTH